MNKTRPAKKNKTVKRRKDTTNIPREIKSPRRSEESLNLALKTLEKS